jgi:uncharacterized SAM-binding protein YcdF (DUF218 family)
MFLNMAIHALILPPASLFIVIFIGLALWRRWPRAGRIVAGTGFALLTLLSSIAGSALLVDPLERMTRPLWLPQRAGGQAIVVLAAGRMSRAPEYDGLDIPDYIALARLRYAARLQRRTHLPILVSGGVGAHAYRTPGPNGRAYSMADAMAMALVQDFGVPVKWSEPRSRDTRENADFSAAILRPAGVRRILLVTDAMHMPRAHAAFERAGLEVIDAPTMLFGDQDLTFSDWLPSAEGMRRSWYASYEWIGLVWYRLRDGDRHGNGAAKALPVAPPPGR